MRTFRDMNEASDHYEAILGRYNFDLVRLPNCEGTDVLHVYENGEKWVQVQGDHELYEPVKLGDDSHDYVVYKRVVIIQWKVVVGNGRDYELEHFDTEAEATERFQDIVEEMVANRTPV